MVSLSGVQQPRTGTLGIYPAGAAGGSGAGGFAALGCQTRAGRAGSVLPLQRDEVEEEGAGSVV